MPSFTLEALHASTRFLQRFVGMNQFICTPLGWSLGTCLCLFTLVLDVQELVTILLGGILYVLLTKRSLRRSSFQGLEKENSLIDAGKQRSTSLTLKRDPLQPVVHKVASRAPKLQREVWGLEIQKFLSESQPTLEMQEGAHKVLKLICQSSSTLLPMAKVFSQVYGNILSRTELTTCIPAIEVTLSCPLTIQQVVTTESDIESKANHDLRQNQMHTLVQHLVSKHGFRCGQMYTKQNYPRATVLMPAKCGVFKQSVTVEISMQANRSSRTSDVIHACSKRCPQMNDLALLVQHWAFKRRIIDPSKGNLPSNVWSLLVIFYLQVGHPDGNNLMPPFGALKHSDASPCPASSTMSVGALFKGFFRFYHKEFDIRTEMVSVLAGKRGQRGLPLRTSNLRLGQAGIVKVAPCIEDPCNIAEDLGANMSAESILHLQEEFERSDMLCSQHASLADVLRA